MEDFLLKALLSLAVGAIVGVERENTGRILGLRSFSIIAFLGLLISGLSNSLLFVLIGLSGVFILSSIYYFRSGKGSKLSLSTALMIPFTFVLGVLVSNGYFLEAGSSAILVTFILSQKAKVHSIISTLTRQEVTDGLIFCICAIVVYPLIPTVPVPVFGFSFDFKAAWIVVVLVMFLSFVSHLLIKYFKEKGPLYSAFLSSWVSSALYLTLVVDKLDPNDYRSFKTYLLISVLGSLSRTAFLALILTPASFQILLPLLLPLVACLLWFLDRVHRHEFKLKALDPKFSLFHALKFSFLFVLVSFLILLTIKYDSGLYLVFFGSGFISSASAIANLSQQFYNIPIQKEVFIVAFIVLGELVLKNILLLSRLKKEWFKAVMLPSLVIACLSFIGALL